MADEMTIGQAAAACDTLARAFRGFETLAGVIRAADAAAREVARHEAKRATMGEEMDRLTFQKTTLTDEITAATSHLASVKADLAAAAAQRQSDLTADVDARKRATREAELAGIATRQAIEADLAPLREELASVQAALAEAKATIAALHKAAA